MQKKKKKPTQKTVIGLAYTRLSSGFALGGWSSNSRQQIQKEESSPCPTSPTPPPPFFPKFPAMKRTERTQKKDDFSTPGYSHTVKKERTPSLFSSWVLICFSFLSFYNLLLMSSFCQPQNVTNS